MAIELSEDDDGLDSLDGVSKSKNPSRLALQRQDNGHRTMDRFDRRLAKEIRGRNTRIRIFTHLGATTNPRFEKVQGFDQLEMEGQMAKEVLFWANQIGHAERNGE